MIGLDVDSIARDAAIRACGECGEPSVHFRACADCACTVARCDACGGNKAASREMFLHRQREHGVQFQIAGTETPADPALDAIRPRRREDCEPCAVCQAFFDSGALAPVGELLECGHPIELAANHCRPCPWVSCRHHNLIEIAKAKPRYRTDRAGRKIQRDARPTTIRLNRAPEPGKLGRRPGLNAQDPTEVVQAWIDDAVGHLETMPESCSLDVADENADGFQLVGVARILGVTTAAIKEEVGPAAYALREGLAEYEDHVPADHTSLLGRVQDS